MKKVTLIFSLLLPLFLVDIGPVYGNPNLESVPILDGQEYFGDAVSTEDQKLFSISIAHQLLGHRDTRTRTISLSTDIYLGAKLGGAIWFTVGGVQALKAAFHKGGNLWQGNVGLITGGLIWHFSNNIPHSQQIMFGEIANNQFFPQIVVGNIPLFSDVDSLISDVFYFQDWEKWSQRLRGVQSKPYLQVRSEFHNLVSSIKDKQKHSKVAGQRDEALLGKLDAAIHFLRANNYQAFIDLLLLNEPGEKDDVIQRWERVKRWIGHEMTEIESMAKDPKKFDQAIDRIQEFEFVGSFEFISSDIPIHLLVAGFIELGHSPQPQEFQNKLGAIKSIAPIALR